MKPLIAAILWTMLHSTTANLLIVDKNLKKPAAHATSFTTELYLQRNFPVYANEVQALMDEVDKTVKKLDKDFICDHTIKTGTVHTTILVREGCDENQGLNVTLITQIDETNDSFSFVLVQNEKDIQRVQRKLLDFATYIGQ